jgi:hypothetical protein
MDAKGLDEKEKFIIFNYLKSKETKKDATDDSLYVNFSKRAMLGDPDLDAEVILSIGDGLKPEDAQRLIDWNRQALTPGRDKLNKAQKEATDLIEKSVVKGNQLIGYDAQSLSDAARAIDDFRDALNNPPEGVDIFELMDPDSSNYIVDDIISRHQIGIDEQIRRMADQYQSVDAIRRKTGESIEDYEKRIKQ